MEINRLSKHATAWLFACLLATTAAAQQATTLDAYESLRTIQPGFAKHTNLHAVKDPVSVPVVRTVPAKKTKLARSAPTKKKAVSKPKSRQRVDVIVDLSDQSMRVKIGGKTTHTWRVSTGRKGHRTPTGHYKPGRMHREYYSKKYYNSPMPHSIFFRGGYAIHGTFQTSALGHTASHGCIRLAPSNAKRLFNLVKANGRSRTHIRIKK